MNPAGQPSGLAQRGSQAIAGLAERAQRLAFGLLVAAATVCGAVLLLGVAATSGAVRTLWLIVGGVSAAVAVGAAYWSYRSLGLVIARAAGIRRSLGELASQVSDGDLVDVLSGAGDEGLGVIRRARLIGRLRSAVGSAAGEFQDLSLAVAALARFPAAAALAGGSIVVFGLLGLLFLTVVIV